MYYVCHHNRRQLHWQNIKNYWSSKWWDRCSCSRQNYEGFVSKLFHFVFVSFDRREETKCARGSMPSYLVTDSMPSNCRSCNPSEAAEVAARQVQGECEHQSREPRQRGRHQQTAGWQGEGGGSSGEQSSSHCGQPVSWCWVQGGLRDIIVTLL